MLTAIKLLHTVVWAFFVACIVGIPIAAARRRFRWAAVLSALVLVECAVLAVNGGRCPLTDVAARYTAERVDNFDIYLPVWLARWNKVLFGGLWLAGEAFAVVCWWRERGVRVKEKLALTQADCVPHSSQRKA